MHNVSTQQNHGHGHGHISHSNSGVGSATGVSQHTRHARRIYVGGIPAGFADEELLKAFLNNIISKGLNEENDNSYCLSVYINQKKFFAFVEFKSIDLTTACLELDGLIYHTSVLKILRANEYKPELVPSSGNPPIKLHLPASSFGTPTAGSSSTHQLIPGESPSSSMDLRLDYSFIQSSPMTAVDQDSIVLIGFPYDDSTRRAAGRAGSSVSPKAVRNIIRKNGAGALINPEFGIDISDVAIFDVGDVTPGLSMEEANARLASTIAEVIRRGAIPFVLGGSCELCYGMAVGLMAVAGGSLGIAYISSQLDVKPPVVGEAKNHLGGPYRQLLEDPRFCPPRSGLSNHSCEGRLVYFGAQGSMCPVEHAKFVLQRGGRIVWLSKDLCQPSAIFGGQEAVDDSSHSTSSRSSGGGTPQMQFQKVIDSLGENVAAGTRRPVYVSFNAGVMAYHACPGSLVTANSSMGLTADEILDMAMMAGADSNVVAFDVCELLPEIEEARSARLLTDIFYRFAAGVAIRLIATSVPAELQLAPPPSRSGSTQPMGMGGGLMDSDAAVHMHIHAYQQQQQQKSLRMHQQHQQLQHQQLQHQQLQHQQQHQHRLLQQQQQHHQQQRLLRAQFGDQAPLTSPHSSCSASVEEPMPMPLTHLLRAGSVPSRSGSMDDMSFRSSERSAGPCRSGSAEDFGLYVDTSRHRMTETQMGRRLAVGPGGVSGNPGFSGSGGLYGPAGPWPAAMGSQGQQPQGPQGPQGAQNLAREISLSRQSTPGMMGVSRQGTPAVPEYDSGSGGGSYHDYNMGRAGPLDLSPSKGLSHGNNAASGGGGGGRPGSNLGAGGVTPLSQSSSQDSFDFESSSYRGGGGGESGNLQGNLTLGPSGGIISLGRAGHAGQLGPGMFPLPPFEGGSGGGLAAPPGLGGGSRFPTPGIHPLNEADVYAAALNVQDSAEVHSDNGSSMGSMGSIGSSLQDQQDAYHAAKNFSRSVGFVSSFQPSSQGHNSHGNGSLEGSHHGSLASEGL